MRHQAETDHRHVHDQIQDKDRNALHTGARMKSPQRMSFKIHRDQGLDRGRRSVRLRLKSEQRRDCSVPIWRGVWCVADSDRGAKTSLATLRTNMTSQRGTIWQSMPISIPDCLPK